jgi:hypothetical protein
VARGALPGLVAGLSPDARRELLTTESYTCHEGWKGVVDRYVAMTRATRWLMSLTSS